MADRPAPGVAAPDEETTAYARTALLAYAARETRDEPRRAPRYARARPAPRTPDARRPARRRAPAQGAALRARRRRLRGRDRRRRGRAAVRRRARAPRIARVGAGARRGGARQALRAHPGRAGADRRRDARPALAPLPGREETSPAPTSTSTTAGTSTASRSPSSKRHTDDIGEGVPKLEREAAKAAITLPADQARRRMIDATFGPKGEPAPGPASTRPPPPRDARSSSTSPVRRRRPRPSAMIDDNRVWIGAHGRADRRRRRPRRARRRHAAAEHDRSGQGLRPRRDARHPQHGLPGRLRRDADRRRARPA